MQAHVLRLLDPERETTMSDLADALHCDASNITGIADRLEARDLVERRGAPRDRRVKALVLTPAGLETRDRAREAMREPPEAIRGLSKADQRALRDILRRAVRPEAGFRLRHRAAGRDVRPWGGELMQFHTTPAGNTLVTLIPGDGIGPEVVDSAREIIEAAGAQVDWEERRAGASVFMQGLATGVPDETIESIRKTRVVLKGPLETPVGFGEKSANVTLRKLFETYGNISPARELPGIVTPYSGRGIDLVVVRENVEDLYAGIEHMQTPGVAQCLKLISRKGCEKIVRLAFEFARAEGRQTVHCATKSNIMKLTEGMLKRTFEEIAPEYPGIEAQHIIVDNCAHQLVKRPGAVRRDRHDEHERRHPQRPLVGTRRRPRLRPVGEPRQRGRHLRGRPRIGAEVRGKKRHQPDGADPVGGHAASPPR